MPRRTYSIERPRRQPRWFVFTWRLSDKPATALLAAVKGGEAGAAHP